MTVSSSWNLFPLRASLKERDSWEFVLNFKNESPKPSRVLLEIDLPREATFKQAGYSTRFEERYEMLKPGEMVSLKMPIFVSRYAQPGTFPAKVRLSEHFGDYGYVVSDQSKELLLRIVP